MITDAREITKVRQFVPYGRHAALIVRTLFAHRDRFYLEAVGYRPITVDEEDWGMVLHMETAGTLPSVIEPMDMGVVQLASQQALEWAVNWGDMSLAEASMAIMGVNKHAYRQYTTKRSHQ